MPAGPEIVLEPFSHRAMGRRQTEYVERKGVGHPDSICDAVMEEISLALSREYLARTGRVLHHNVDKGLLVAGQSHPRLGGGTVTESMRLVVGDRATDRLGSMVFPIGEIVTATAHSWFQEHLRFVDPPQHLRIQNELKSGSAELVSIFGGDVSLGTPAAAGENSEPPIYVANDTSAAVGFAPLSETERLVLVAEKYLNSPEVKRQFPEAGEDVKVMAVRRERVLWLTIAVAFVDRFITSPRAYFARKQELTAAVQRFLTPQLDELDRLEVQLNMLDDESRGLDGMYLTVLGTSAESGDGGEVGRGNRVNGLISFSRPMSTEAAAGKNPVSHVGKVYNVLASQIAQRVHRSVSGIEEVYIWLCSQIGCPLDQPFSVAAQVALAPSATLDDIAAPLRDVVQDELAQIGAFTQRLIAGEFPVC